MTYLNPLEYNVIPRQWRVVKHRQAGDVVAAMLPYPGPDDLFACAGDDAYTADMSPRAGVTRAQVEYMRGKCSRCPVQMACMEYGIAHESSGMWGGLTEAERKTVRRERGQIMVEPHTAYEYGLGDNWFDMLNPGNDANMEGGWMSAKS